MRSRFTLVLVVAAMLIISLPATAQSPQTNALSSPVGVWKTISDKTHKPASLVKIWVENGQLMGKVIKVLNSDKGPHPICDKCEGERHNKPVVGMTIIWGMHKDGDEWDGGTILDPKTGETYKCSIELVDGGMKLKVRGYIGFSLFGRTQVWLREPAKVAVPTPPAAASSSAAPPAASTSVALPVTATSTVPPAVTASSGN